MLYFNQKPPKTLSFTCSEIAQKSPKTIFYFPKKDYLKKKKKSLTKTKKENKRFLWLIKPKNNNEIKKSSQVLSSPIFPPIMSDATSVTRMPLSCERFSR